MKIHNLISNVILCLGKAFGTARNLEVHYVVHTGYKPFICRMCGKAFARKAEIRDHERIHTGEKPYQCEFCGATFRYYLLIIHDFILRAVQNIVFMFFTFIIVKEATCSLINELPTMMINDINVRIVVKDLKDVVY